ncbi:hypothetical protein BS329_25805 [Amycolatopsis coloradensis]|uniref:Uncharacterized protein n=1 Tax=Amycolatopsis coloradensis TaxID=76021 RepID=A0A1R0KL20_9PSEU|nr:hypothetical protein BS329_25805 [Amycolatopsis coloradensis]
MGGLGDDLVNGLARAGRLTAEQEAFRRTTNDWYDANFKGDLPAWASPLLRFQVSSYGKPLVRRGRRRPIRGWRRPPRSPWARWTSR